LDVVDVGDDFGRHKEFFSRDAGFADRQAELLLGVVDFGAIKVAEADTDRLFDGVDGGAVDGVEVGSLEEGRACAIRELATFCQSAGAPVYYDTR
jgi:hypothetical protein